MNTFTLGACFQHELHTGPYFMTFAPRLKEQIFILLLRVHTKTYTSVSGILFSSLFLCSVREAEFSKVFIPNLADQSQFAEICSQFLRLQSVHFCCAYSKPKYCSPGPRCQNAQSSLFSIFPSGSPLNAYQAVQIDKGKPQLPHLGQLAKLNQQTVKRYFFTSISFYNLGQNRRKRQKATSEILKEIQRQSLQDLMV